jgi:hypothetical protein
VNSLAHLREDFFADFFFADFFFTDFFAPVVFDAVFFAGTFAPDLRASDKPIAIACFRLVTFFPLRPDLSFPFFMAFISRSTDEEALGLYFLVLDFFAAFFAAFFFVAIALFSLKPARGSSNGKREIATRLCASGRDNAAGSLENVLYVRRHKRRQPSCFTTASAGAMLERREDRDQRIERGLSQGRS